MTIPIERVYAITNVRNFLYDLMDPKKTPKVPKKYRVIARQLLKHYPGDYDMERASKKAPDVFGLEKRKGKK